MFVLTASMCRPMKSVFMIDNIIERLYLYGCQIHGFAISNYFFLVLKISFVFNQ